MLQQFGLYEYVSARFQSADMKPRHSWISDLSDGEDDDEEVVVGMGSEERQVSPSIDHLVYIW